MNKIILVFALSIPFLFWNCDGNEKEIQTLQKEKKELENKLERKDSSMLVFVNSVNEIEENLQQIKEKEDIIGMTTADDAGMEGDVAERIKKDVQMINNLLEQNDQKIKELTRQLESSQADVKGFKTMIARLKNRINEKDRQIDSLKSKLQEMNFAMEDLNAIVDTMAKANERQTEKIIEQEEELNKAYYAFGTFKELKEKGVAKKEGGIIGIGSTEKLRDNFNRDYFTEIDIRRKQSIPLFVDKAEVITSHPSNSYELLERGNKIDSLKITDPKAFWSASKYLVVVVD